MATAAAINAFASVVHDAQPTTATGINLFASVVHDSQPATATGINLYASVVHDAQPPTATGINLFASVVHDPVQISGTVADITGTVGNPATFDATPVGTPTGSAAYLWSWQSVPVGSLISSASFALPDSGSTTPVNMSGNVGLWHFEGNADDSSGNDNNGTVNGATQVTGRIGLHAYEFNGSSDSISVPSTSSLQITGDVSITAWIKADSYSEWEPIIQYAGAGETEANNYLYNVCFANATGDIRFFWERDGGVNVQTDFDTNLNTGQWYHVVAVRNTSEKKAYLYVDGELFGSDTYSDNATGGSTSQLLMGSDAANPYYFDGTIDEVAIWNRALSGPDAARLFFLNSGSCASGSVGIGQTFTFMPDVTGTYTIQLGLEDGVASPISGNVDAYISAPVDPTGSLPCIEPSVANPQLILGRGLVINNYLNLSAGRQRRTNQVPFRLGGKDRLGLRFSDTISTTSGSIPTYCTGS